MAVSTGTGTGKVAEGSTSDFEIALGTTDRFAVSRIPVVSSECGICVRRPLRFFEIVLKRPRISIHRLRCAFTFTTASLARTSDEG